MEEPDKLEQLTARLERPLSEIMKETDPVRYDELGDEIWQVLGERIHVAGKIEEAQPPKALSSIQ